MAPRASSLRPPISKVGAYPIWSRKVRRYFHSRVWTNPEHAAMLRVSPDGKQRTIFASGLRNTIGFAFHPSTGKFWGIDQGLDHLGNDQQPEELNLLERGNRYGWPYAWGKDGINPQGEVPGEITRAQWQAMSTPMVLGYTAHASAMQMVFYTGDQFPAESSKSTRALASRW